MDLIERAFEKFHADNPDVYDRLRDMALSLKRMGKDSYGIAALVEVLRYEQAVRTRSADGLKLNNNYSALYARRLAQNEPTLREFFKLRMRRPRGTVGQVVVAGDATSPAVDAWDNPI